MTELFSALASGWAGGAGDPHPVLGAGAEQGGQVREVMVDRVALDSGAFGDRTDRRVCRADRAVQVERRLRDALARGVELFAPPSHPIGPLSRWFQLLRHVHRKY